MNKIALTVAAILVATGSAFAGGGSDHYGSNNPIANIDNSSTASVRKPGMKPFKGIDTKMKTGAGTTEHPVVFAPIPSDNRGK